MKITHNLTIDLQRRGNLQKIDVVQGDTYTRLVNISLYNNGVLWDVPANSGILVRYHKPDGTSGIYEELPDGSPAGVVEENNVLVTLAPQMLTAPGKVPTQVSIVIDDQVLSTFSFIVDVEEDPSKGAVGSENYHSWKSSFIPQTSGAFVGQYLEISKVDSHGRIEKVKSVVNPAISAELAAGEAKRIAQNAEFNANEALEASDVAKNLAIRNSDDIATLSSSKLPQVTGAKVGQYIKITEVDELGRVVAFEAVNAPTSGSISGDLEMKGDAINNVGSLSFIGPNNTSVDGFWIQSGMAVSKEDGSKTSVAEFYSSDTDEGVVIRNVAPGVEDSDAVNVAQLSEKISQPTGEIKVGQTIVIKEVNEAGFPVAWETKDFPPGGNVDLTGYATEQWVKDQKYLTEVPEGYAKDEDIPTKPEDIGAQPSGDYALKSEIPSVPVQSVNGKTGKVQLSAAEVGARPDNWMPTAQEVGALPSTYTPPNQTAEQVGADPTGTAASAVSQHNVSADSHGDIRLELKAINDRLTAFFDSDNQTLDELSEIVAYITSNKALIDSITTSKVSVADIINNLTTNVANKPLSAAQGVAMKGLIDAVSSSLSNYQPKGDYALRSELPTVPTKVSQLENDTGYLTEHQDISGKLDADKLPEAINTALAQAKASGEFNGPKGDTGATGAAGKDGADGKTPVRGTDYWTDADQEAIVQQVITALGTPVFGRVDADNNIILTGELVEGTYTVKYEDAEGEQTEIGTLNHTVVPEPTYTNLLPLAINSDGTPYNGGKGWKTGYRLNSSGTETAQEGIEVVGFIPATRSDIVYFANIDWPYDHADAQYFYIALYDSNFAKLYSTRLNAIGGRNDGLTYDGDKNAISINISLFADYYGVTADVAYIRISALSITKDSIITKNEPIV